MEKTKNGPEMNERFGEILVGTALALRGSSLLFAKIAMRTMGPFLLMGTRFFIAFAIVGIIFHRKLLTVTLQELKYCASVGFFLFLSMAFELRGLQTTTSTVTAFLEGMVVVIVPMINCALERKLPDRLTVITSVIAIIGVGFLTLKGDRVGFTAGELLVLGGAVWYSCSTIATDRASKNCDPMNVAIYQLLFIGLFAFMGALVFEDIRLPESGTEWGAVLGLAIICSGVGFTLQPLGQKYITAERAGLLTVMNPLAASALGIIFLNERLTPSIAAGAVLIMISIFYPAWVKERESRCAAAEGDD